MPFVKVDCDILNSTLWADKPARDVFMTSLLMAIPFATDEPIPQMEVRTQKLTGFIVPAGRYGFVNTASIGIIVRAQVDSESGLQALERLGEPEAMSRSPEFDGRRMVRVSGGFLILNYDKYRERDYTAPERARRYRQRIASQRNITPKSRNVTQAEAYTEAEVQDQVEGGGVLVAHEGDPQPPPSPQRINSSVGLIRSPLGYDRAVKNCAYVGARLEVPHKLHADLVRETGGPTADPDLRTWYASVDEALEASGEAIAPDVFKWLRVRWRAWVEHRTFEAEMAKIAGAQ